MAKKIPSKKPRSINQRFTALERLVRTGFQRTDARFRQVDRRLGLVQLDIRGLRKEINERFTVMMDRIEERLSRVEAAQAS